MKKYVIPILLAFVLIAIASFLYVRNFSSSSTKEDSYDATKVSTENQVMEENTVTEIKIPAITENEFTQFSTKVSGTKARKNNITICTSFLNGATIEPGQTFSFWSTVGNTTAEKGYQKAKSFDEHGKTIQTYGGGVCQVSTTLYNAVLTSNELSVIERHPHSKAVTYVPKDKDASVCYSSSDFKFVNNSPNAIKIYASYEHPTLTIRLVKLSNS